LKRLSIATTTLASGALLAWLLLSGRHEVTTRTATHDVASRERMAVGSPELPAGCGHPMFPEEIGSRRTYEVITASGEGTLSFRVADAREEPAGWLVEWEVQLSSGSNVSPWARYGRRCGDSGAEAYFDGFPTALVHTIESPWRWPSELRPGSTFGGTARMWVLGQPEQLVETRFLVEGEEEIDVIAGHFRALRVRRERGAGSRTQRALLWVVAGLGLVREQQLDHAGHVHTSYELVSSDDG
jgi:hypothetical protein